MLTRGTSGYILWKASKVMPDPKQLQYLLELLEDDSAEVRETVVAELSAFGVSLESELARQRLKPGPAQQQVLDEILNAQRIAWLREHWHEWFGSANGKEKLETALTLLAEFQLGSNYPTRLPELLDGLSRDYVSAHRRQDARSLAGFLFQELGLRGASDDYYNPSNSNLVRVIEEKRGIPISLACVYILVGHRVGIPIEGCNFPGHFFALATVEQRKVLVDCYNGGTMIADGDLERVKATVTLSDLVKLECDAHAIVSRVLRNLVQAYQKFGNDPHAALMAELLDTMEYGQV